MGFAKVSWTANTESDLAGYKVYHGWVSGTYFRSVNVGNVTTYTFSDIPAGRTHYFAVTAYDTSNNESAFSTEMTKTVAFERVEVVF